MDINKTNIIITGAGSGFGKKMSIHFAALGATIYALDIDVISLEKLKKENKDRIHTFKCDVSSNDKEHSS